MSQNVQGVLRVYYTSQNAVEVVEKAQAVLVEQLGRVPKLVREFDRDFAAVEIDCPNEAVPSHAAFLDRLAAIPGCTGALFMSVAGYMGKNNYLPNTNMSAEQYKRRTSAMILETIHNLTRFRYAEADD